MAYRHSERVGLPGANVSVSLGWKAAHEQYSPEDLLEHAVLAEKAGIGSVWASDHFLPWSNSGAHCGFAWVWMAAVAERTRNMTVGTGVTAPLFRYNPGIVAQAFATLGRLYPGRVMLGLGSGEPMNEVPLGYKWPSVRERVGRLEEAVRVIRQLWTDEWVSYHGKYYTLKNARLYTKPRRPVPLYIAAFTPEVARLVGQYADGFYSFLGKPLDYYRNTLFPMVKKGASDSDRDFGKLDSAIEMLFSYDKEDLERATNAARFWKGALLPVFTKHGVYDPREIDENAGKVGDEAMREAWIITTDTEKIVKRVRECFHAGFKQVVLMSSSPEQEKTIEMLGKEVVPHLKEEYSLKR